MSKLLISLAAASFLAMPVLAKTVSYTYKGVTTFNIVNAGPITEEFPVGTPWTLEVAWDDSSAPMYLGETQSQYRLTKLTLTFKGVSGNWTTSSLADKASFTLNHIFGGTVHEIQFTSGWGPADHTNQNIENLQPYSINVILSDPTGTAIPKLSPAPSSIDLADFSLSKSSFKIYLNNEASNVIYGSVSSSSSSSGPEISVQQPKGTELVDGKAKRSFGIVAVGETGSLKTFTIRNTGSSKLTGLKVTKSGTCKGDFVVGPLPATSLPPGGSTTFKASFKPLAKGSRTAKLHIASNDANENPFDIAVSGTGE